MSTEKVLFYNNDNVIELKNVKNAVDDQLITQATVTLDINDSDGNSIVSGTSMNHVQSGTYRTTLDKGKFGTTSSDLQLLNNYKAVITASTSSGLDGEWNVDLVVREREGS